MNSIGLLNHREFVVMLFGFVVISISGSALDVTLLSFGYSDIQMSWHIMLVISIHLVYSIIFLRFVSNIFKLHFWFISRNELSNDWKEDSFYRVDASTKMS